MILRLGEGAEREVSLALGKKVWAKRGEEEVGLALACRPIWRDG